MIQVTCPNCASKLSAKEALIGQTRKCPKCAQPVRIVADTAPAELVGVAIAEARPDQHIQAAAEECLPSNRPSSYRLPSQHVLERLARDSHYLICSSQRLVATWENDGRGWMLKTNAGFVSVKRNRDDLPTQGDFKLVELKFSMTPDGRRLSGILTYQLATRWALKVLDEADDLILSKITSLGCLNKDQKKVVFRAMKDQFMANVWSQATEVLEYLDNTDYHSPGVSVGGDAPAAEATHLSMVDFLGAAVFVASRPPRGFDFAAHVFQAFNPKAAQSLIERQYATTPSITQQYLGAMGFGDEEFVAEARKLSKEEDPSKGAAKCVIVVQENRLRLDTGDNYHTVICSYFRAKSAKELVLSAGESLDKLLD